MRVSIANTDAPAEPDTGGPSMRWADHRLSPAERLPDAVLRERCTRPAFGTVLTEHMVSLKWSADEGWHDGELLPYAPLPMDPAMVGLHYGQVVFEGLKAFRQMDGSVAAFRAYDHARRFQRSARRLAMPELPEQLFVSAIDELVRADLRWVPSGESQSLYLRPLLYATDPSLALQPAREYRFLLLAFVTESFFGAHGSPVSVWATSRYTRAAPGGTGEAKCAGNYAPGFLAQQEAAEHGCQQVIWLDAGQRRWVEEMGGMNVFWVRERDGGTTLTTPQLTGTLLPGITRDSLLTLAGEHGMRTEQRQLSLEQWCSEARSGVITESFACGTAAVVTPIGKIVTQEGEWPVGTGTTGEVCRELRSALVGIQRGAAVDRFGWLHPVEGTLPD